LDLFILKELLTERAKRELQRGKTV